MTPLEEHADDLRKAVWLLTELQRVLDDVTRQRDAALALVDEFRELAEDAVKGRAAS